MGQKPGVRSHYGSGAGRRPVAGPDRRCAMGGFFMGGAWGLGERATCKARGFGSFGLGGARAAGQGGSSKLSLLFTCLGWSWTLVYLRSVVWSREGMNGITEARKSGIADGREWAQMQGKSADRAIPRDPVTDSKLQAKAARRRLASLLIRDEKSARRKRKKAAPDLPKLPSPPPSLPPPHASPGPGGPPSQVPAPRPRRRLASVSGLLAGLLTRTPVTAAELAPAAAAAEELAQFFTCVLGARSARATDARRGSVVFQGALPRRDEPKGRLRRATNRPRPTDSAG